MKEASVTPSTLTNVAVTTIVTIDESIVFILECIKYFLRYFLFCLHSSSMSQKGLPLFLLCCARSIFPPPSKPKKNGRVNWPPVYPNTKPTCTSSLRLLKNFQKVAKELQVNLMNCDPTFCLPLSLPFLLNTSSS